MNLQEKMKAVISDVNAQMAEREELVEAMALALLTRKNLFVLGEPGQAKSFAITEFCKRISGARKFERLLTKQGDEEQLFGRIDLQSLIPGNVSQEILDNDPVYQNLQKELLDKQLLVESGKTELLEEIASLTEKAEGYRRSLALLHENEPRMITSGKIPDSDIVFIDEIFKANDGVLNALLTALNERKYTNEGHTCNIPVISFFSASNEIPNFNNPEEKILEALYDRLEIKVVTENVIDRDNRLKALKNKQRGMSSSQVQVNITLDDLNAMQHAVSQVTVPDMINELMDDVLCELRYKGIKVSDRKYFNYFPLAQAKAWLDSRTEVAPYDLCILHLYLWSQPSERDLIRETLERMCNDPLAQKISEIRNMARESFEVFEDSVDAKAASRIGKLRTEYTRLYGMMLELRSKYQNERECQQLDELQSAMEGYSQKAHALVGFTHMPLEQVYALDNR